MNQLYGEAFIERIRSFLPEARPVAGRRELVVRCRYCGDSKDPKKAHMYISVPQSPEDISLYECKKCKTGGIVDSAFLQTYGCSDNELMVDIAKHAEAIKRSPKYAMMKRDNKYNIKNFYISNPMDAQRKVDYINSRLGSHLSIEQCLGLKIFFNLNDILLGNNLQPTRHAGTIEDLSNHFVGFMTYDNSKGILRKCNDIPLINPNLGSKYINYHFIPQDQVPEKCMYYVIPTQIDVESLEPTQIHVAEGVFDVLGIMLHVCKGNLRQAVYVSASGKSYAQAIEFILKHTGIINYAIHLYPDADVSDGELYRIALCKLQNLPATIYIHRNMYPNEKDYGVNRGCIKDTIVRTIHEQ